MKKRSRFLVTIGIIFLLLVGTSLYAILRDNDPYKYFTGLGNDFDIAPDESKITFSYYVDGEESIYTANLNGTQVKKITDSENKRNHRPKFSPDGEQIVYLSKNQEGIQTIQIMNVDGSEERQLTDSNIHIRDAIFSHDGETIFFTGVKAVEFKKGEESREGFDLYSIAANGGEMKKLTDADNFSMNHLFLSPDGQTIYYNEFDGVKERIYSYSTDSGKINTSQSIGPNKLVSTQSFYHPQLSPSGKYLAFTEVSRESQESSLFEYELFLLDLKTNNVERLTNLNKSVTSPAFYQEENKIVFLENTNWPKDPAEYQLMMIDIATSNIETIELDTPQSSGGKPFIQMLDRSINIYTIAALYILLMVLVSFYLHAYSGKAYLPTIVSFLIAILLFVSSFGVAAIVNPWYGIGLGMLAAGIFACSIIIVLIIFIYKFIIKGRIH